MEKHAGRDAISCLLPCVLYFMESELIMFNVWVTVGTRNLWRHWCKALLWRKFVGALRTTTTNCRLTFIDLYLVFTNFRIVFLPHTKTVILLELYCGTITESGLPVVPDISRGLLMVGHLENEVWWPPHVFTVAGQSKNPTRWNRKQT